MSYDRIEGPDIPTLWHAYTLIDENGEYVELVDGAELELVRPEVDTEQPESIKPSTELIPGEGGADSWDF